MAFNSTNRFASLSAEVCEAKYLAEQKEAEEKAVFEEACAYLEDTDISDSYTNLLESSIQICENDSKVFNTSIELDFVSAMNESASILDESAQNKLNEARCQKLQEQVNKIAEFTKVSIESCGANFNETSLKLHKANKNVFEKYMEAIVHGKMEGYKGTSNFLFPTKESADQIDSLINVHDITDIVNTVTSDIDKAITKESVNECANVFTKYMEEVRKNRSACIKCCCSCHENWIPSDEDIAVMESYCNDCTTVSKSMSEASCKACKAVDEVTDTINKALSNCCGDAHKANILYNLESAACRSIIESFNAYRDMEVRELASYRAAIINCGKYAIKESNGIHESADLQEVNESAVIEASNQYVFDLFEE